jgi:hypothetical protein
MKEQDCDPLPPEQLGACWCLFRRRARCNGFGVSHFRSVNVNFIEWINDFLEGIIPLICVCIEG